MARIPPETGAGKTGDEERKKKKPSGVVEERTADDDDGDEECGPECRNLLHEVGHPREEARCPGAGQVIDIWGYCRSVNTDIVTLHWCLFTKRLFSLTRDTRIF